MGKEIVTERVAGALKMIVVHFLLVVEYHMNLQA